MAVLIFHCANPSCTYSEIVSQHQGNWGYLFDILGVEEIFNEVDFLLMFTMLALHKHKLLFLEFKKDINLFLQNSQSSHFQLFRHLEPYLTPPASRSESPVLLINQGEADKLNDPESIKIKKDGYVLRFYHSECIPDGIGIYFTPLKLDYKIYETNTVILLQIAEAFRNDAIIRQQPHAQLRRDLLHKATVFLKRPYELYVGHAFHERYTAIEQCDDCLFALKPNGIIHVWKINSNAAYTFLGDDEYVIKTEKLRSFVPTSLKNDTSIIYQQKTSSRKWSKKKLIAKKYNVDVISNASEGQDKDIGDEARSMHRVMRVSPCGRYIVFFEKKSRARKELTCVYLGDELNSFIQSDKKPIITRIITSAAIKVIKSTEVGVDDYIYIATTVLASTSPYLWTFQRTPRGLFFVDQYSLAIAQPYNCINYVTFHPTEELMLISCHDGGNICFWEIQKNARHLKCVYHHRIGSDIVHHLSISEDGKILIAATNYGLYVYEIANQQLGSTYLAKYTNWLLVARHNIIQSAIIQASDHIYFIAALEKSSSRLGQDPLLIPMVFMRQVEGQKFLSVPQPNFEPPPQTDKYLLPKTRLDKYKELDEQLKDAKGKPREVNNFITEFLNIIQNMQEDTDEIEIMVVLLRVVPHFYADDIDPSISRDNFMRILKKLKPPDYGILPFDDTAKKSEKNTYNFNCAIVRCGLIVMVLFCMYKFAIKPYNDELTFDIWEKYLTKIFEKLNESSFWQHKEVALYAGYALELIKSIKKENSADSLEHLTRLGQFAGVIINNASKVLDACIKVVRTKDLTALALFTITAEIINPLFGLAIGVVSVSIIVHDIIKAIQQDTPIPGVFSAIFKLLAAQYKKDDGTLDLDEFVNLISCVQALAKRNIPNFNYSALISHVIWGTFEGLWHRNQCNGEVTARNIQEIINNRKGKLNKIHPNIIIFAEHFCSMLSKSVFSANYNKASPVLFSIKGPDPSKPIENKLIRAFVWGMPELPAH